MNCPPYVLLWNIDLCFWVRLSDDRQHFVSCSPRGFQSEAEAENDYRWRFATT